MLFNSLIFIFIFLPLCLSAFAIAARRSQRAAIAVLAIASMIFYGWFDIDLLPLILISILGNHGAGQIIAWLRVHNPTWVREALISAVAANISMLAYFKYSNFFLSTISSLTGQLVLSTDIALPLGISFFTFTQIAFLVDTAQGKAQEYDFPRYLLFVTYFPHLVAGPILHHGQMMPQFARFGRNMRFNAMATAVGLTCFSVGLIKKMGLADSIAPISDAVFSAAQAGAHLSMSEAWTGALAYTFQIYFDFSGYCDMAVGLSLLFGVRLPANFNSPYKATSIIDFWRRWHMTLSRFLRDYLYIPLGGNRNGPWRTYVNLMATMLLGGLWHGAGWTFVAWGALHGAFLAINHLWRQSRLRVGFGLNWALTFVCVVVAWVFFRADSITTAVHIIGAMMSLDGLTWEKKLTFPNELVLSRMSTWGMEAALLAIILALPNVQQLLARFCPVLDDTPHNTPWPRSLCWRPTIAWGLASGAALTIGVTLIGGDSPFLYFQF